MREDEPFTLQPVDGTPKRFRVKELPFPDLRKWVQKAGEKHGNRWAQLGMSAEGTIKLDLSKWIPVLGKPTESLSFRASSSAKTSLPAKRKPVPQFHYTAGTLALTVLADGQGNVFFEFAELTEGKENGG